MLIQNKHFCIFICILKAKLYLNHIKTDRYRIKYLVDCFPSNTAKRQRDKSASSYLGTHVKHQNRRSSRNSSPKREGKTDKKHSSLKQRERVKDHTGGRLC